MSAAGERRRHRDATLARSKSRPALHLNGAPFWARCRGLEHEARFIADLPARCLTLLTLLALLRFGVITDERYRGGERRDAEKGGDAALNG